MSLETPTEGRCNYPLTYICQSCGKIVKKKTNLCKCGGKLEPASFCGNGAGKGTDHKGEGLCYHHDPSFESISMRGRLGCSIVNLIHGHYSKYARNVLLVNYEEEILEILRMLENDPDQVLAIVTAKATLLYSKSGDPRQAKVIIEGLKEMVATEKQKREKGLVVPKEPEDLAEKIVQKYFKMRESNEKED